MSNTRREETRQTERNIDNLEDVLDVLDHLRVLVVLLHFGQSQRVLFRTDLFLARLKDQKNKQNKPVNFGALVEREREATRP